MFNRVCRSVRLRWQCAMCREIDCRAQDFGRPLKRHYGLYLYSSTFQMRCEIDDDGIPRVSFFFLKKIILRLLDNSAQCADRGFSYIIS